MSGPGRGRGSLGRVQEPGASTAGRPGDRHIVVAAVALVRDGCVLTVRKRGTQRFMLVGGKLEPGESARDAALRETREEVGLAIESATLLGEFLSEAANEPGHTLHSTVFWVESDAEPVASAEIAEVRWTPLRDHPDDLAPMLEHHVLPVILSTITNR
jgi:8-oxo-dGTP diphosphatase